VYRTAQTAIISGWDERFNKEIYERYDHDRLLRMFVPIKVRERVIGVLEIAYDREDKQLIADAEIDLVQALVDQIAVALENVRLLTVTRQALQDTEMLYDTTRRLAAADSAPEMLVAVAERSGVPGLTHALMWLIRRDDVDHLQGVASVLCWHQDQGVVPVPAHVQRLVKGWSLRERLTLGPQYVEDAARVELADDTVHGLVTEWQLGSLAWLPISHSQRGIGMLMLVGEEPHAFTASEKRRLESLSDQLAVGLDRLYLTEQVQDSFEREKALRQMMDRVRAAVDVEGVMHAAVRETGRLLRRSAVIYLGDPAGLAGSTGDGQNGE
jgi:GAF domain-containing protein